jgi:alkylated DNA repair protein alkB family protein 1
LDKHFVAAKDRYFFNRKTRWANLGRHYDWDNRRYFDGPGSPIPLDFKAMAQTVNDLLKLDDYNPEAVIVNYYTEKDYMGGHLDDGEPDQTHPIVSLSFGLSCVFMIGGRSKDDPPKSILLESGDACVMSGHSRLCYHGVPRIIPGSFRPPPLELVEFWLSERKASPAETNLQWNAIRFLSENRINANFRQVVEDPFISLSPPHFDAPAEIGEVKTVLSGNK